MLVSIAERTSVVIERVADESLTPLLGVALVFGVASHTAIRPFKVLFCGLRFI
jgi:hypothetical protein